MESVRPSVTKTKYATDTMRENNEILLAGTCWVILNSLKFKGWKVKYLSISCYPLSSWKMPNGQRLRLRHRFHCCFVRNYCYFRAARQNVVRPEWSQSSGPSKGRRGRPGRGQGVVQARGCWQADSWNYVVHIDFLLICCLSWNFGKVLFLIILCYFTNLKFM